MAYPFRTNVDMGQNQILNAVIQVLGSDPGTGVQGQVYYNSTSNTLRYFNGSVWGPVGGGGSGTVTTVSVVSANGFAGTVASATSTPAITLSTSISGLLKGNGTAISAAVSGTDYAPATSGTSILKASSGGFANAVAGTDYLAPAGSGAALTGITESQVTNLTTDLAAKAPLASPTFTGTPAAPTAAAGTNTTQLATTAFVQAAASAAAQGLSIKDSCVAATVGTETYTIVSGSVTVINGTTIDGQTPAIGDRILVWSAPASSGVGSANSTQPGNGIYAVTANTTNLTVSRSADMSGTVNLPAGSFTFIEGGTANGNAGFVVSVPSTNAAFTYGTGNIKWTQFSGAGELTVGTGLTKSGNTISLTTPVAAANGGAGAVSGILKANGSGTVSAAVSATDYAPATTGSSILKASSGGFANAVASTDYAPATSGSAILKGNGSGGFSNAAAGTDYVAATSGSAIQKANGSGGLTAATAGTDYLAPTGSGAGLTGLPKMYQGFVPTGTAPVVTHSLGNQYPVVKVYEVSSGNEIICDVNATNTTQVTLGFAVAATTNQYTCTIIG